MPDFKTLADAGSVGVSLALIAMVCFLAKLLGNHLDHLNKAILEMTVVLAKLGSTVDKALNKIEKKYNK